MLFCPSCCYFYYKRHLVTAFVMVVKLTQQDERDFILLITHVGEAVQLPALVLTDHSIQQHPLRAIQLLGRHAHFDVIIQPCAGWKRKESAKHSKHGTDSPFGWLALGVTCLPSCGAMIFAISEESFFFSSTRVSISFIRFPISSVILAAVSLSALRVKERGNYTSLAANSQVSCTKVFVFFLKSYFCLSLSFLGMTSSGVHVSWI